MENDQDPMNKVEIDPSLRKRSRLDGIEKLTALVEKELKSKEQPSTGRRLAESVAGGVVATAVVAVVVFAMSKIL